MKVPSPGESITEVEIATWLVSDGDYVEKDQAIAEVDSDKATLELPAEEAGIITLKAEEGDVVEVGQVVCLIDTAAARPEGAAATAASPNPEPVVEKAAPAAPQADTYATGTASPAAKKMMAETGAKVSRGTGKDGRITKADVIDAVASMGSAGNGERGSTSKKMSSLRRKLASRLVTVKNETAMLTTFNEVDMTALMALRSTYRQEFEAAYGTRLGFMGMFVLASIKALQEFPAVNAEIDGTNIIYKNYYNIGVAVGTPQGLVVPVVRDAGGLGLAEIESRIADFGDRARNGKITPDDMAGGSFTISNGGVYGSLMSTPILNPPQSGILGMHKTQMRPMAVGDKVEIRPMMYLALSYDHRIIDGREAVTFLVRVKEAIEDPRRLLLDM